MNNVVFTETETNRWGWVITTSIVQTSPTTFKSVVAKHIPQAPHNDSEHISEYQMVNGVPKWLTNDQVPPSDSITELKIDRTPGFNATKTKQERSVEVSAHVAEYRAFEALTPSQKAQKMGITLQQYRAIQSEQAYELRAAFGSGRTVVNILTGKTTRS